MTRVQKVLGWVLLCSLWWVAACSTGTAIKSAAPLTPAEQEEQDPMFWRMWGSSHGIGP